jgi:hypothetical protein
MSRPAAVTAALGLLFVFAVAQLPDATSSFAWVSATGDVVSTSTVAPIVVKRIAEGHYCFNFQGNSFAFPTYAAVAVTLQTGASGSGGPGFARANTGWGDDCNPFGGAAVYTFSANGSAADAAFSFVTMWQT